MWRRSAVASGQVGREEGRKGRGREGEKNWPGRLLAVGKDGGGGDVLPAVTKRAGRWVAVSRGSGRRRTD